METLIEIINYIRENNQLDKLESLNPEDKLQSDIGFDSFDLAELTVRIEDKLGIDIFEDGIVNKV
ncbi:MAG: acyl carrier protein, partial [Candidatus Cloacimonetes bacterium]|nr:acyl carrier protein [Candidatus Cloacimonadota bacterium]